MFKKSSFFTLLYHDVIEGIIRRWFFYLIAAVFFIFCSAAFFNEINSVFMNGRETPVAGFTDYWIYLFNGIKPYDQNSLEGFRIPMIWLVFHSFLAIIVGFYAADDLSRNATAYMIRVKSRTKWWLSKCIWCTFSVLAYYLICSLVFVLFLIFTGSVSFGANSVICGEILEIDITNISNFNLIFISLMLPLIMSVAVSVFQVTLTLFFKPIFCCVFLLSYVVVSAYYCNLFFIYNYSMICRNIEFLPNGNITVENGIVLSFFLLIFSYIIGNIKIKRKDII